MKVLSRVFRGKFLARLKRLHDRKKLCCSGPSAALADPQQFAGLIRRLHRHDWVVYAKPAFGGPLQVLRYLGRYTHRVGISNHRLLAFEADRVSFRWKDYAHGSKQGRMGTRAGKVSPDGSRIVTLDVARQKYVLVDVASGKVSEIPGLEQEDEVVGWSVDGNIVIA